MSNSKKLIGELIADCVQHFKVFNKNPDRIVVSYMLFKALKNRKPVIVHQDSGRDKIGGIDLIQDVRLTGLQYRFEDKTGVRYAEKSS